MDKNKELIKEILIFFQNINEKDIKSLLSNSIDKEKEKKINFFVKVKKEYQELEKNLSEYQELQEENNDKETNLILRQEIEQLEIQKHELFEKIKKELIKEEGIKQNILIEIRPGTGGVEAGLFVRDLYRMYCKFIDKRNWKLELIETNVDSAGNFNFVSFSVKGKEIFDYLKYESGVHRVQRVPDTESKGRVHTSTATVVVLPEAQEINVKINPQDLKIETHRSSGAGGQHVNTTDSAVRITHLPTGVVAVSQDGRSQHDNREKALFVLKTRIFEKYRKEQDKKIGNLRSSAIGTGERAEKIRTYNYPQNRITDHRVNESWYKLDSIMEGDLEEICQTLKSYEIEQKLNDYQNLLK